MKLEHKAGIDIIYELAVNLYPSALQSFREAISNALDEGTRKVEIHISLQEIIVEDWGEGIKDLDKFTKFGDYAKAKIGGETIGEKGLGKLSLLRLGNNVEFRTNNGEYGIRIMMTAKEFSDVDMGSLTKYLAHQGTQIVIPNPEEVPVVDELSDYLKKCFGLRIASGTEILLNGIKLESKSKIDATEKFICRLKGSIDVTGNIKAEKKGKGSLDIYVKHVFVTSVIIDPSRRFSGWVNCNALTPTTARNEVKDNNIYSDMIDHLQEYVTRFPKIEEEIGREEITLGNELAKLLGNYLKDMNLLPKGKLPFGRGKEPKLDGQESKGKMKEKREEDKELEEHEYVKQYRSPKTNKPIRRSVRTNYGINWIDQDYGNEKDPLFSPAPTSNIVVRNRTNDLYKFALKNKTSLGPKWLRLVPYLARLAITLSSDYPKLTREQTNMEIDRATRYFLSQKGEL